MIGLIMRFGGEIAQIRIVENRIFFSKDGFSFKDINGLRLSYKGVLKEHPDLEGNSEWRKKAIERFQEYIHNLKGEHKIAEYVIDELKKFGWEPMYEQKKGFRPKRIKNGRI